MKVLHSKERKLPSLRQLLVTALAATYTLATSSEAEAEPPSAPVAVQAQIVTRILPFERNFAAHQKSGVTVIVATRPGDADSGNAARQMKRALTEIGTVANQPITAVLYDYTDPAALAAECQKRKAQVTYVSPGLASEVPGIAAALANSGVLTVAAVEQYVPRGAVLGVEVVAGKPRMSVNLAQARAQKLDFPSAVLKLARIY